MHVAVVDIGKPDKNLGWSIVGPMGSRGTDVDECVSKLATVLRNGPLALGFEAPMFVPKRQKPSALTAARKGECGKGLPSRPFSAGAGAAVLVTGLVVVPYILSRLKEQRPNAMAQVDWRSPLSRPDQLLLFEAFVTNQAKNHDDRHMEDANLAAEAARQGLADPSCLQSAVTVDEEYFNLLGAMMLRTGWSADIGVLTQPCLVVRA